jgi:nitrite transporter NirC
VPIAIPDALDDQDGLAATKATQATSRRPRFAFSAVLAGAYVGVAVVLLISVSAPLVVAGSPAAKLVQGAVFGIALTLVVFAGAELFTGNVMVMLQGLVRRQVGVSKVLLVLALSLVGNLVGSLLLAGVVHGAGTLASGAGAEVVGSITSAKAATPGLQLFWRAVLCNMLVCLGLWMAHRTRSDVAKLVVLWWALLAFIASGFEHSVANMTIFGLGILGGTATWADLASNLGWTLSGNVVGGGIIVGLGYAWLGSRPTASRHQPVPAAGDGLDGGAHVGEPAPQPADDGLDRVGVGVLAGPGPLEQPLLRDHGARAL